MLSREGGVQNRLYDIDLEGFRYRFRAAKEVATEYVNHSLGLSNHYLRGKR
jgi:hypothetical protein